MLLTVDEAVHKVVSLAYGEVGYHEGVNNYNKYAESPLITRLYGWNLQHQPWCAVFVNWLFLTTFDYAIGSRITYGGSPGCAAQAQLYRNNNAYYPTQSAQKGDQIFFIVDGGINHTGIIVDVSGSTITTVEGNSSDSVAERTYFIGDSKIAGVGRPNWSLVGDASPDEPDVPEPVETCTVTMRVLRYGATGTDVRILQTALRDLGYNIGRWGADGDFGRDTEAAVKELQIDCNLEPDGIAGKDTWQIIFQ